MLYIKGINGRSVLEELEINRQDIRLQLPSSDLLDRGTLIGVLGKELELSKERISSS